jgi:Leucine-rich repeat (LRR) protein
MRIAVIIALVAFLAPTRADRDVTLLCRKDFYLLRCQFQEQDFFDDAEIVNVVKTQASDSSTAAAMKAEKYVRIDNDNVPKIMAKGIGSRFANLTLLKVVLSRLEKIDRSAFTNMRKLTTLDLSYNEIVDIPSDAFEDLTNLTTVNLAGNKIRRLHVDLFVRNLHLEEFTAVKNELGRFSDVLFRNNDRLKRIAVTQNFFNIVEFNFTNFAHLTDIEVFNRNTEGCADAYHRDQATFDSKGNPNANNFCELINSAVDCSNAVRNFQARLVKFCKIFRV